LAYVSVFGLASCGSLNSCEHAGVAIVTSPLGKFCWAPVGAKIDPSFCERGVAHHRQL